MKKLFLLLTLFLLIGCTMQEEEINEVLQKLKEMGQSLDQLEGLAKEENWEHFKQNVYLANESLTHVNLAIDEAESRGEDAEFILRVRNDYAYLSKQFEALIISADVVQNLEKAKPLMEELERKHTDSINPALELLDRVLADIDKYSQAVDEMQAVSEKMIDYDKNLLNVDSALGKMQKTKNQFEKRKGEFASLKEQLTSLKEKLGL
jgi:hypothetical protein